MPCLAAVERLATFSSNVGQGSFAALAFLVSVLTIYVELSRDRIVIERSAFRTLVASTYLLVFNVFFWLAMSAGLAWPGEHVTCRSAVVYSGTIALCLSTGIAALLFGRFIFQIRRAVREAQNYRR